jgi:hypothetical protein
VLDWLLQSVWAGPTVWAVVSISDYSTTIAVARLYAAQDKVRFEGSYEITPIFQSDVNALRRVSPRFVLILAASTGYLFLVRIFVQPAPGGESFYEAVLGGLLLVQVAVHMRHFRNWYLFKHAFTGVRGQLDYGRVSVLRSSSFEILMYAALYLGLYCLWLDPFFLGGVFACCVLSANHRLLARRHLKRQLKADRPSRA